MSISHRIGIILIFALGWLCGPVAAQENDKDYLTRLLQDSLAGNGRIVDVTGFSGALSSEAKITQITISDTRGVWLVMKGLTMQWNRSGLLRGRLDIERLAAEEIHLERLPEQPAGAAPSPEAQAFKLPELPVSVKIASLTVGSFSLGKAVLGEEVLLALDASLGLADGVGQVAFNAVRKDSKRGNFKIAASFESEKEVLSLDVSLNEAKGGIAATLLNLPSNPSVEMFVQGQGPLDDFSAKLRLATDGAERLGGTVRLLASDAGGRTFETAVKGDVTALFAPQYREFFGDNVQLQLVGARGADGALEVSKLALKTREFSATGAMKLDAQYWPVKLDVAAALDGRGAVLLPLPGKETKLDTGVLQLSYDRAVSDEWTGLLTLRDLERDDVQLQRLDMNVRGVLDKAGDNPGQVAAAITFAANGLAIRDGALADAVGDGVSGAFSVAYEKEKPLKLSGLSLRTATAELTGSAQIKSLSDSFETDLDARLNLPDLARFSGVAQRPLKGQADVGLKGSVALGGFFDLALHGDVIDLAVSQPQADKVLRGKTVLEVMAKRGTDGITLKAATIKTPQLFVAASGRLASNDAALSYDVQLAEAGAFDARLKGPLRAVGTATLDKEGWRVAVEAQGPLQGSAEIHGLITGPDAKVRFKAGVPDIKPVVKAYSGPLALEGTVAQSTQGWRIDTLLSGPYGMTADVSGVITGAEPQLRYGVRLPDVRPFAPQISGPLALNGTVKQVDALWRVETQVAGPQGAKAQVAGTIAQGGEMQLTVVGSAPLELSAPLVRPRSLQGLGSFDLSIRGKPSLNAVSGRIWTQGARMAAPELPFTLNDIAARAVLENGQAQVLFETAISSGGRVTVSGPIQLGEGMASDLSIKVQQVQVSDPKLYRTSLDGALKIVGGLASGALISGQINLGETNINVPSTGTGGFTIVPEIAHVGARKDVQETQKRAGLGKQTATAAGGGPDFGLNVSISAPSRIFVRGRGIDAELGGQLTLAGSTKKIVSVGRFDLIRGRLDLLEKRFVLSEGNVQLQGDLDPYLRFVAQTQTSEGTASIVLEGLASSLQVSFEAVPDAPQDEILAQIYFKRNISELSAFQAVQLVNAVATLAGKGGQGIVSRLRGSFGLDDLDIGTDADGNTSGSAGKYISENVYSSVTAGTGGASVSLNVDLTPSITARGTVSSTGDSKLGIFFERDY